MENLTLEALKFKLLEELFAAKLRILAEMDQNPNTANLQILEKKAEILSILESNL